MQAGTMVCLQYTARDAVGQVIDTTQEKTAIQEGIFDQRKKYAAQLAIIGEQELPQSIETALDGMKPGDTKKVLVPAREAFGERKAEFVAVVPLKEFRSRKLNPVPGLIVDLNGQRGRVQSVSGGRVRVDFNHPLAGKEIMYEVQLERIVQSPNEQITLLFDKYFAGIPEKERKLTHAGSSVEVTLPGSMVARTASIKEAFVHQLMEHVQGIEKVVFSETFEKKKEEARTGNKK